GPILIGLLINVFLFGVVVVQMYIYYTTYKKYIFIVFVVDAANTVFNVIYIYNGVIVHFGLLIYSTFIPKSIIGLMVQLCFAWRIYVLTSSRLMVMVVVGLASTGAVGGLIVAYGAVAVPEFTALQELQKFVIIWLVGASAADITITATLVWFLIQRHKTGFRRSDIMVDRIIRVTMQTGLVTSVVAIVNMIVFIIELTMILRRHLLINLTLSKLYSNSLISNLNSRGGWKY
ncbi:hypothetical protein P691DRAFT_652540, partial [Macrolepiota fuliginosa MF-IS2]